MKAGQTGRERRSVCVCVFEVGVGGRYVVISNEKLTEAWEQDSGGVICVRTASGSVKFCLKCRCRNIVAVSCNITACP